MSKKSDKKKNTVHDLPTQIFAIVEHEHGGATYLSASETLLEFGNGDIVGVYKLVEVRTKSVTHELK